MLPRKPNFLIVGAQKSGTTSMTNYLAVQQEIFLGVNPELSLCEGHFFERDEFYERGIPWYKTWFQNATPDQLTFECTPAYMWQETAVRRIHRHMPNVKLLVLLRNPVTRAYSQYQQFCYLRAKGKKVADAMRIRDFEQYIQENLEGGPIAREGCLTRGHYAEQLERIYELYAFDRVLVMFQESFAVKTQQHICKVRRFLGLTETPTWTGIPYKYTATATRYEPMKPQTRRMLQAYFRPHNKRLFKLINRPQVLDWMKE